MGRPEPLLVFTTALIGLLDTTLFSYFKGIKAAPDMSIPTSRIGKTFSFQTPWASPWMSYSDEG